MPTGDVTRSATGRTGLTSLLGRFERASNRHRSELTTGGLVVVVVVGDHRRGSGSASFATAYQPSHGPVNPRETVQTVTSEDLPHVAAGTTRCVLIDTLSLNGCCATARISAP